MYELLTGELPFGGGSVAVVGLNVSGKAPSPPGELREDVPADLERVVLRCLEKDPDKRFPDVNALAHALRACQRRRAAAIRREAVTLRSDDAQSLPEPSRVSRAKGFVAMAAAALLAFLVVAGVATNRRERGASPPPPGPAAAAAHSATVPPQPQATSSQVAPPKATAVR
jgi:serine/threonine protein kinase